MKPLDIECPTCYSGKDMGCFDKTRGEWYPEGIFHASRIQSRECPNCSGMGRISQPDWIARATILVDCPECNGWGNKQPSLFPDTEPKQMTLSQRYGDMEIK